TRLLIARPGMHGVPKNFVPCAFERARRETASGGERILEREVGFRRRGMSHDKDRKMLFDAKCEGPYGPDGRRGSLVNNRATVWTTFCGGDSKNRSWPIRNAVSQ